MKKMHNLLLSLEEQHLRKHLDIYLETKRILDYYNLTFSVQKIEDGMKKQNNIFWNC